MRREQSNLLGAAYGFGAMALFACFDTSIKFLGTGYNPLQIVVFTGLMGIPIVLAYALFRREEGAFRPRAPGWMALRVAMILVNGTLGTYAFANLPLAQCYAILFTMPIFIALFGVPLLGEAIDPVRGLAVLFGLAGVIVTLDLGEAQLMPAHGAALGASMLGSLNYVILRKIGGQESAVALQLYPLLAQVIVLGPFMAIYHVPMPPAHLGLTAVMALFAFLGYLMIIEAYRRAPAIVVAPMQYSQILWAALFGALLFHEWPKPTIWLGAAMIIAGGLVVVLRQDRKPA